MQLLTPLTPLQYAKFQSVTADAKQKPTPAGKGTRRLLPGLSIKDGYTPIPSTLSLASRPAASSPAVISKAAIRTTATQPHTTASPRLSFTPWSSAGKKPLPQPRSPKPHSSTSAPAWAVLSCLPQRSISNPLSASNFTRSSPPSPAPTPGFGAPPAAIAAVIRIVEADAVEFPLPPGPVVVFLFNPFGATVIRRLLRSWKKHAHAAPRPAGLALRQQRAGARARVLPNLPPPLPRQSAAISFRRHRRPQNHGQPARSRIRLVQLGRLLHLALQRLAPPIPCPSNMKIYKLFMKAI